MDEIYSYPKNQPPQSATFSFLQTVTIELIIILVGFNLIIVVLNYFNVVPVSQKFPKYFAFLPHQPPISTTRPKLNGLTTIPTPTINQKLYALPIALDKPQVRNAYITYILTGYIGEISEVEDGFNLSFKDRSLPTFFIGSKTGVVREEGNTQTPIQPTDLKLDDSVRVNASFDLVKKIWNTNRVILLTPQT